MSVDDILLVGRIALVGALYLFVAMLAFILRRELRVGDSLAEERAPGDLLVIEPFDTEFDPGERIPLLSSSTIGRSSDNTIVLDDTFVSSEHARLTWNGKGWVLEDLVSTNGTQVNGQRVKRATPIQAGDIIELGRVKVKLVLL